MPAVPTQRRFSFAPIIIWIGRLQSLEQGEKERVPDETSDARDHDQRITCPIRHPHGRMTIIFHGKNKSCKIITRDDARMLVGAQRFAVKVEFRFGREIFCDLLT